MSTARKEGNIPGGWTNYGYGFGYFRLTYFLHTGALSAKPNKITQSETRRQQASGAMEGKLHYDEQRTTENEGGIGSLVLTSFRGSR